MSMHILPGTPEYLEIEIKGRLTHKDYEACMPEFERLLSGVDSVNVLVRAEAFSGWDLHAAWDDIKLGFKYRDAFSKIAWVGPIHWPEFLNQFSEYFFSCTFKQFDEADLVKAQKWLGEE